MTLTVKKRTLADLEQRLAYIAPDDAKLERTQVERSPDYQVTALSGAGFRVGYDGRGSFSIEMVSDILPRYLSEGEGENALLPSKTEASVPHMEPKRWRVCSLRMRLA